MEDMEDDVIAAAMGFSSFGGTKKRKYDQTNSPKVEADASGANTTRLGVRSKAKLDPSQEASDNGIDPEASSNVIESQQALAKNKTKQKQRQPAATGLAAFLSRGQDIPERPATEENHVAVPPPRDDSSTSLMVSFGGPSIPQTELAALRNGVVDENGDKAYFLPSFVEDPWGKSSNGSK
ncbi:hypothetical protein P171DRAFT_271789 [Karstenula rhodostoma CBS 690.94]|uniref:Uncharacterized protein n=1 Tax=Karstenula rhodostoma CBS 690.94 TaxID=1392251 RepID=A0A9P4UDT1_9PLEO|nr:hypothetical protein P171DRAFT_271789 [Karstenula rhodostoma CBS 690.94]